MSDFIPKYKGVEVKEFHRKISRFDPSAEEYEKLQGRVVKAENPKSWVVIFGRFQEDTGIVESSTMRESEAFQDLDRYIFTNITF